MSQGTDMYGVLTYLLTVREAVTEQIGEVFHRLQADDSADTVELAQWVSGHGPEIFVGDAAPDGLPGLCLSVYYDQETTDLRKRLERVALRMAVLRGEGQVRFEIVQRAEDTAGRYWLAVTVLHGVVDLATIVVDRWGAEMPVVSDRLGTILTIICKNYWFIGGPAHPPHLNNGRGC